MNPALKALLCTAGLALAGCGHEAKPPYSTTIEEYDYLTALEDPTPEHKARLKQLERDAAVREALEKRASQPKPSAAGR